jgi:hypothetical protein
MEREIPFENTDIALSNSGDRPTASSHGGVEIASLDLSRLWEPLNLHSYRAEYQMEAWFDDDAGDTNLSMTMTFEVTANPPAQHIISTYEGKMLPEELSTMETEMYILEGIVYTKSNLFEGWVAYESELADLTSDILLNPQDYVILPEKAERKVAPETINGISSWHYTFDEDDIKNPIVEYEEVRTETWIAVEGGYIVKLESFVKGADLSKDLDENSLLGLAENSHIHTTYEMRDINSDFTIVLPPEAAEAEISDLFSMFDTEWTRDDVLFPEEAQIEYSFENTISLHTSWSVQQTKDYMLTQLQINGWVLQMEHLNSQDNYLSDFKKDDDVLSLSIDKNILEPELTSIYVETKKNVPWSRADVPLPEDAYVEQSLEGEVQFLTFLNVEEATAYMTAQLEANGWASAMEPLKTEDKFIGTFSKEMESISLIIDPTFDELSRTRIQITIE